MRLKRGQAPKSAIIRQEKNRISVGNLYALLESCIKSPSNVSADLEAACKSQRALAEFSLTSHQIYPMSLTTLKTSSELSVPGGWAEMDRLRRLIVPSVRTADGSGTTKRGTLSRRETSHAQAAEKFAALARDYAILARAYFELLNLTTSIIHEDESLERKVKQHQAIFSIKPVLQSVKRAD
jgi:hypothetical protein